MDRTAIFTEVLCRNALRREVGLPRLDVRAEYHRAVQVARWREIVHEHYEFFAEDVLRERRSNNPDWGNSAGGRLALHLLTQQALRERYGRSR